MGKLSPRHAVVNRDICVACGTCVDVCPMGAMQLVQGSYACPVEEKCVGCGMCAKECPATAIQVEVRE